MKQRLIYWVVSSLKSITGLVDFKENDLEPDLATTCDWGSRFNGLQGLGIHNTCWCKQRNSPIGEYKSNDRVMNQEGLHPQHSGFHWWVTALSRNSKPAKNPVAQR